MSTDDDFTAYVGTRWSPLVRVALLLGGAERAETVVQDALLRSYQHWARVWQADRADVDVLIHALDGIYTPLGRIWRGERASAEPLPGSIPAPETREQPPEVPDLVRALRPLAPVHRDVLVLTYVAELTAAQAAAVLDVSPDTLRARLEEALAAVEPCGLQDELR